MTNRQAGMIASDGFQFRIRDGLLWMCGVELALATAFVIAFWGDFVAPRPSLWIIALWATVVLRALGIRSQRLQFASSAAWLPSRLVLASVVASAVLWASACLLVSDQSSTIAQTATALAGTVIACAACGFLPGGGLSAAAYLAPAMLGAILGAVFLTIPLSAQVSMLSLVFLAIACVVQFWTRRLIASSTSLGKQLLLAKQAAENASAVKSAIIANTSHELRTPLNAVIGFSEAISQQILGPIENDKYLDYAKSIHDSGRHLLQIINDILDISRIESGKYEMNESSVPIKKVIEFATRMINDSATKSGVTIRGEFSENLPRLTADERMLKQIVLNLLSNAVKFTPMGGTITIGAGPWNDDEYCIFIEDSGIGIPEDDLERVFEPFVQIEGAFNRRHQGTGLGLALVRAMAEQHHARLELQSTLGRGTTARVCFPLSRVIYPSLGRQDLAHIG